MTKADLVRLALLPIVLFVAFWICIFSYGFLVEPFSRWLEPPLGFVTALTLVLVAYRIAPACKMAVVAMVYGVGLAIAWSLLKDAWYPEPYPDLAYRQTYLPFLTTAGGGAIGCVLSLLLHGRRRRGRNGPV